MWVWMKWAQPVFVLTDRFLENHISYNGLHFGDDVSNHTQRTVTWWPTGSLWSPWKPSNKSNKNSLWLAFKVYGLISDVFPPLLLPSMRIVGNQFRAFHFASGWFFYVWVDPPGNVKKFSFLTGWPSVCVCVCDYTWLAIEFMIETWQQKFTRPVRDYSVLFYFWFLEQIELLLKTSTSGNLSGVNQSELRLSLILIKFDSVNKMAIRVS